MPQNRLQKNILPVIAAVLAFLVFISGILVCDMLTAIRDNTPSTEFSVVLGKASAPWSMKKGGSGLRAVPLTAAAGPMARSLRASASIYDDDQVWSKETTVALFLAEYANDSGEITVRSAYGDKVIAPGTANRYHFYIRNDGRTPIDYTVDTTAELTARINGQTHAIPLQASFYNTDGDYLLGTASGYDAMGKLHGIHDEGQLSVGHYTRYTLDWLWPFEGDDTLDTLLGNLAAEGDSITVTVTINVTATGNDQAAGGLPKTGDTGRIGLWMAVMTSSMTLLIILLFIRRKDENEKEQA